MSNRIQRGKLPSWLSGSIMFGAVGLIWWLERRRPLRQRVEQIGLRTRRNLAVAALGAVSLQIIERPVVSRMTQLINRRKWGLLKIFQLPAWLEVVLAVMLMDYTLYLWHVLMHRSRFLWRFHVPHHVDLDLDASTALRFHFGELALAAGWRIAQVAVIGVSPLSLSVWQTFLLVSIVFHHSNVSLPIHVERQLNRFFVTPRMHGIHHSIIEDETNSNWSSGLTIWDRLHGTLRLSVPQEEITIGVPAYRAPSEVGFIRVIELPFVEQRPTWLLPGNGQPVRRQISDQNGRLLR